MPGPGEYRPDPTEGITRIEDLPKPKVRCQSRNYRRRPCPRCGHSAYRDRQFRRTLHDLGNPLTGRPCDRIVIYSQHYCTRCRKYFNADMTDLAAPGSHYTRRVVDTAVRLSSRTAYRIAPPVGASGAITACSSLTPRSRTGSRTGGKGAAANQRRLTSTGHSRTSRASSPPTSCMTGRSASSRSSITAPSSGSPTRSSTTTRPRRHRGVLSPLPRGPADAWIDPPGDHDRRLGAVPGADRHGLRRREASTLHVSTSFTT